MGRIILVDGPEKAGKTTLCRHLEAHWGFRYRHWGPVPGDHVYADALAGDIASGDDVVWDRGWVAEHVYARLLGRDRRLREDPWLGEWLYGRAVQATGVRVVLAGPSDFTEAIGARDTTDLPVDPWAERRLYVEYGRRFGYLVRYNERTEGDLQALAAEVVHAAQRAVPTRGLVPPAFCGPTTARVVVVGEARNAHSPVSMPGAWLPFTSRLTEQYGRALGDAALKCAWTNIGDFDPTQIAPAATLVACGRKAAQWCRAEAPGHRLVEVPHPSFLYRWDRAAAQRRPTEDILIRTIQGAL